MKKKKGSRKKEKATYKVVEVKGVSYVRKDYVRRGKPKTTYKKLK